METFRVEYLHSEGFNQMLTDRSFRLFNYNIDGTLQQLKEGDYLSHEVSNKIIQREKIIDSLPDDLIRILCRRPPSLGRSMAGPPPCPPPPPGEAAAADPDSPEPSALHRFPVTLLQPSTQRKQNRSKPTKMLHSFRSAFRALPIIAVPPGCRIPTAALSRGSSSNAHRDGRVHGTRTTGTLFGHRKARITLAFQENPRSVPHLLLEVAVPTARFMQDMGSSGLVRVALECEKKVATGRKSRRVLDEPMWTAYVNGRSVGYAARRDPTELDLGVMQLLHAVSMGAGVLPADKTDPVDGELTYMRAYFDRVIGSKDSETFYMLNPDGNAGPELSIFFVRI
ncbi:uncharacterized protein LOC122048437 [Zingiber officinale]|nr:uncharacterized protein LOC122048437 [Zingiber officinale]